MAHDLAEKALKSGTDFVGAQDEMSAHLQSYIDYVRELANGVPIDVERRVDLNEWIPGGFGTSDAIIHNGSTTHVIDLKYGMTLVSAEDNPQLMLYGLGSITPETETVELHIAQPRVANWSRVVMRADDLRAWGETIKPKAALCLTDDAPLVPAESACKWCLAAPNCPALYAKTTHLVGGDFDALPDVETLTDEQVAAVVINKKLLTIFIDKIESRALTDLESGHALPGLKLVEARTNRAYNDQAVEVIPKLLGESAYKPPTLIAMGQAEKLIGKKRFSELGVTIKPKGKSVVVSENDRRPAITLTVDDFSTL